MKKLELKQFVINWLSTQSKDYKVLPAQFTCTMITNKIGGYPGALGKVADAVVAELSARGVKIRYIRNSKSPIFDLY